MVKKLDLVKMQKFDLGLAEHIMPRFTSLRITHVITLTD